MSNRSLSALNKKYLKSGGFTAPDTAAYQGPHGDYAYEAAQGAQANFLAAQRQLEEEERKRRQLAIQQGQSYQINRDSAAMMAQANSAPTNYISDAEKALYGYAPEDQAAIKSYNDVMQQISDATERPSRVMMNGKSAQSKNISDLEKQASKMRKSWDKTGRVPEGLDTVSSRIRNTTQSELKDALTADSQKNIDRVNRDNYAAWEKDWNAKYHPNDWDPSATAPKPVDHVERTQNQEFTLAEYQIGRLDNKTRDLLKQAYDAEQEEAEWLAAGSDRKTERMAGEAGMRKDAALKQIKDSTKYSDDDIAKLRQYYGELADYQSAQKTKVDAMKNLHTGNAAKDFAAGVGYTAADAATHLLPNSSWVEHLKKAMGGYADNSAPVNTYGQAYAMSNFVNAGKNATSQRIGETKAGKAGQWGYDFTTNLLENGARSLGAGMIGGGLGLGAGAAAATSSNLSLGAMGLDVYTQTYQQGLERGLTQEQARNTAAFNASMEIITEKIPMDKLYEMSMGSKAAFKDLVIDWAAEMGMEGTQELISEYADSLYDLYTNGDKSDMGQEINAYRARGMSDGAAKWSAFMNLNKNAARSFAEGALMGGVMGAGAGIANNLNTRAMAREIYGGADGAALLNEAGNAIDPQADYVNTEAQKNAKTAKELYFEQAKRLEEGQKMQVGKVAKAMSYGERANRLQSRDDEYIERHGGQAQNLAEADQNIAATDQNLTETSQAPHNVQQAGPEATASANVTDTIDKNTHVRDAKVFDMKTGAEMQTVNFEKSQNGQLMVRTTDGLRSVDDLQFESSPVQDLYQYMATKVRDVDAANTAIRIYKPGENVNQFNIAFGRTYAAGRWAGINGTSTEEAFDNFAGHNKSFVDVFGEDRMREMFDAGVQTAVLDARTAATRAMSTAITQKGTGTFRDMRTTKDGGAHFKGIKGWATLLGVDIELDDTGFAKGENGSLDPSTGVMRLNAKSGKVYQTLMHETGEFADAFNAQEWGDVVKTSQSISREVLGDKRYEEVRDTYRKAYPNATEAEIDKEMANDLFYLYGGTEEGIQKITDSIKNQASPERANTIIGKIVDFFDSIIDSFKKLMGQTDEGRLNSYQRDMQKYVDRLQGLRDQAAKAVGGAAANYEKVKVGKDTNVATSDVRHSFSGLESATVDQSMYQRALEMEKEGADENDIYRETGWFKGQDNNWRYEIDDSKAQVYRKGDAQYANNKDYQSYAEMLRTGDFFNSRFKDLDAKYHNAFYGEKTLKDYLDHDALYEAYPFLRDVNVVVKDLEHVKGRSHLGAMPGIEINQSIQNDERFKSVLLHEVQHLIQDEEGFASGTSVAAAGNRENYLRNTGEVEARNTQDRMNMSETERRWNFPRRSENEAVSGGNQIAISRDEMIDNMIKVHNMNNVATVATVDLGFGDSLPENKDKLLAHIKKSGWETIRTNLVGEVKMTSKSIKGLLMHGDGGLATLKYVDAIPEVLFHGEIVQGDVNHKGKGFNTLTMAAPVRFTGKDGGDYYVSVTLKRAFGEDKISQSVYVESVLAMKKGTVSNDKTPTGAQRPLRDVFDKDTSFYSILEHIDEGVKFNTKGDTSAKVSYLADESDKRFSMDTETEEGKTLIAVHNLNADKLRKSLALGGFPMPSIAVTKADIHHTNFGDISFVFGKETIDPKLNKKNNVYSADAWTPVVPRTEYEGNEKRIAEVNKRLNNLSTRVDDTFKSGITNGLADTSSLNSRGGEQGYVDAMRNNTGMKAAYLEEQGHHVDRITKEVEEKPEIRFNPERADEYRAMADMLSDYANGEKLTSLTLADVRNKFGEQMERVRPGVTKSVFMMGAFLRATQAWLDSDGTQPATHYKTVTDVEAMRKAVNSAVDQKEYEAWLKELYSDIEGNTGVYNNKEFFTPSGNSRSFAQTHFPATLDGIVKAMASQNGGNSVNVDQNFYGTKTLRANTAKRFKSVADMHGTEWRLQELSEEQQKKLQHDFDDRISNVITDVLAQREYKSSSIDLIRRENAGRILAEAAELKNISVSSIQKVFKEYSYNLTDETAADIKQLLFDISQMPVNMFEAKPARAVAFTEAKAAIVPAGTDQDLIDQLKGYGIRVMEYKEGDNEDRLAKINSIPDVRFSRDVEDNYDSKPVDDFDLWEQMFDSYYGSDAETTASILERGAKVLNGKTVDKKFVSRVATDLLRDYGSNYDRATLEDNLGKLYALVSEEGINRSDLMNIASEIATPVIEESTQKVGEQEYNDFVEALAPYKIALTDTQMKEVQSAFGTYNNFKRATRGVQFVKSGTPLDTVWSEIVDRSGGVLDYDTAEGDMPTAIYDALQALRPTVKSQFDGNQEEIADDLAFDLVTKLYEEAGKQNGGAGQVATKLRKQQAAYRKSVRDRFQKRYQEQKKLLSEKNRAELASAITAERARTAAAIDQQSMRYKDRLSQAREQGRQRVKEERSSAQVALDNEREVNRQAIRDLKEEHRLNMSDRLAEQREIDRERADARVNAVKQKLAEERSAAQVERANLNDAHRAEIADKLATVRARNAQKMQTASERRKKQYQLKQLQKRTRSVYSMLENPTDTKHVPKVLQKSVLQLMDAIDMANPNIRQTKDGKFRVRILDSYDDNHNMVFDTRDFDTYQQARQAYDAAIERGKGSKGNKTWAGMMQGIKTMYENASKDSYDDGNTGDFAQLLDPSLYEQFNELLERNGGSTSVAELGSKDLETLNRVMMNVQKAIATQNKLISMPSLEVTGIADGIQNHASTVRGRRDHTVAGNFLIDFSMLNLSTPDTYFHGFGKSGDQVYRILLDAQDDKARNLRNIQEATEKILDGVTPKTLERWTGKNAYIYDFKEQGVRMTKAQIMSLYELQKRPQARSHMAGGIKVGVIYDGPLNVVIKQKTKFLTLEDVNQITGTLTSKEKQIADALQQYMANDSAKLGNEVSMQVYGYDKFEVGGTYFPITTDKATHKSKSNNGVPQAVNSIKNMGFTKQLVQDADNALVVNDIFDVFVKHTTDMATYHAYAARLTDVLRVLNSKTKSENAAGSTEYSTVKDAVEAIYGDNGVGYWEKLISDINGMEQSGAYAGEKLTNWLTSSYKASAVLGNFRVVCQQPLSYVRARTLIDDKYLVRAVSSSFTAKAKEINEVTRTQNPLYWAKNQGNIDGYISQSVKAQITGIQSVGEKIQDVTGKPAGLADAVTWEALERAIWYEQEDQFKKDGKAVGKDSPEFVKAVNDRFREVVSQTQVMDSTLFRSQFMRSTNDFAKLQSSFMAEPIKTYNLFLRSIIDVMQSPDDKKARKMLMRAAATYVFSNVVLAAVTAVYDTLHRGDPDKDPLKEFYEKFTGMDGSSEKTIAGVSLDWMDGYLFDNMDPFQMIPIIKDVESGMKQKFLGTSTYGSSASAYYLQALKNFGYAYTETQKYFNGNSKKTGYGVFKKDVQALSQLTGLPAYNLMRDAVGLYNRTIGTVNDAILFSSQDEIKAHYKAQTFGAIEENKDPNALLEKWADAGQKPEGMLNQLKDQYRDEYVELYNSDRKAADELAEKLTPALERADELNAEYKNEEDGGLRVGRTGDAILQSWLKNGDSDDSLKKEKRDMFAVVDDVVLNGNGGAPQIQAAFDTYIKAQNPKTLEEQKDMYGKIELSRYKATYLNLLKADPAAAARMKSRLVETYVMVSDGAGTNAKKSKDQKREYYSKLIDKWSK